jgi:hypothetical protein
MDAVEALNQWARAHTLGPWVSTGTIREIIAGAQGADQWQTEDDLALLRDAVVAGIRKAKVEQVREAMEGLATLANRSEEDILVEGMRGQHPYLLNELIFTLLKAAKEQCCHGGEWDGRIALPLQRFIDEFVV